MNVVFFFLNLMRKICLFFRLYTIILTPVQKIKVDLILGMGVLNASVGIKLSLFVYNFYLKLLDFISLRRVIKFWSRHIFMNIS